jgi:hypothetical protein
VDEELSFSAMLKVVRCANFRALENVEIPLQALTAIVGPNGSGKSAVLDAIDILLGSRWPSMAALALPYDFHRFDTNLDMVIEAAFDPPLIHSDVMGTSHEVSSIRFRCAPYKRSGSWGDKGDLHDELEPLNDEGTVPSVAITRPAKGSRPVFRPLSVSSGLRDQARVLVIDDRRNVVSHLPSRRGSVLSRLLAPAKKEFDADASGAKAEFADQYEHAMEALRTERVKEIENLLGETTKRMLGFLGSSAVGSLDVRFGFTDPANPFNSLRLICQEAGLEMPAELMGLGIQSALVVGIFDALRRIGGDVGTVVIEEPEMYLHPQAQRYFYSLLSEMADSGACQVIYTTHSPIFADMRRFAGIRLLRRPQSEPAAVSYVRDPGDLTYLKDQLEREKLPQYFDATSSEALFARRALLVEGYGDQMAARHTARELRLDVDAEDLSIVGCGGKARVPFFARACRALGIPFVVLHDEDIYAPSVGGSLEKWQEEENQKAPQMNQEILNATGDKELIHLAKPSLEAELGISRNAPEKPKRIMAELQARRLEDYPKALVSAVEHLASLGTTLDADVAETEVQG